MDQPYDDGGRLPCTETPVLNWVNELRWYLIHCKPRDDQRALMHLERQGFECYLPMMSVEKWRDGRLFNVREPLFPRYLFIRLDETEDNWYPIRSTRGVSQLVCCNGRPFPLREEILDGIRARLAMDPVQKPYCQRGDRIEINHGGFVAVEAIFLAHDGNERVVVLLNMMQQDQEMVFPLGAVRKLA